MKKHQFSQRTYKSSNEFPLSETLQIENFKFILANFITWLYEEEKKNVESGVKRVSTQVLHEKHEESSIDATSLLFLSLYCWNLYGYMKLISLYVEIKLASCAWSDSLYISFISVYEYINVSILVFNVSPTCNPKLIF